LDTTDLVGVLPSNLGQAVKGMASFSNSEPYDAACPLPNFGGNTTLAGVFCNRVVVNSSNGNVVLQNPAPGSTGNAPLNAAQARGPGQLGLSGWQYAHGARRLNPDFPRRSDQCF
jgi:hypothetical protein